jgi:D-tyrosyl-tRNA(Tyr) deacylase
MRAVIQRLIQGQVNIDGKITAAIGKGLLVYLGIGKGDSESDAAFIAEKIANFRIFEDADGKMNLSVRDVGGAVLIISQFTLYGDCRKGKRPSFDPAARPDVAEKLYDHTIKLIRDSGLVVETGVFAAHMHVTSTNDGPVTFILDSTGAF